MISLIWRTYKGIVQKSHSNVNALAKTSSLMRFEQSKLIVNSFITFHFSYCQLVCMFHSWRLNNRINHTHERALRIILQNCNSSFTELLSSASSLIIHRGNLKRLLKKMFKVKIGVAPIIMDEILKQIIEWQLPAWLFNKGLRQPSVQLKSGECFSDFIWNSKLSRKNWICTKNIK